MVSFSSSSLLKVKAKAAESARQWQEEKAKA